MQIPQPDFGQRLRRLRTERGMSQRDLALDTVNQSYISLLESGARVPTLEVVLQLARVLDVPFNALVDNVSVPADKAPAFPSDASQLAESLLTDSAIANGDLEQAEQRLTTAYRTAIDGGRPAAALSHGLTLERVLDMRSERHTRYQLLTELIEVAEKVAVPEACVRTRIALSTAARDVGRLSEALTQIERTEQEVIGTAFAGGSEHVRLLGVHISVLSDAGGGVEVTRIVDRMVAMATEVGSVAIRGRAQWVASVALARLGEAERSLEHLRAAREMLANPSTSLLDWARLCRAAASALMDAGADFSEITMHMDAARAATAACEAVADPAASASLEVRYALAAGEPEKALKIATTVDESAFTGIEHVRFVLAVGRAQLRCGDRAAASETLRRAARLAEAAAAYRRATQIWHEVNELTAS